MKKTFLIIACGLVVLSFGLANAALAGSCPSPATKPSPCAATECNTGGWCGCTGTDSTYSCMNKSTGTDCKPNLCSSHSSDVQCCKAKAPGASPAAGGGGESGGGGGGEGGGGATSVELKDLSPVKIEATPAGIAGLIGDVINAALGVVGALALFMFIYGGIYLLSSAGSSEKVKKGKDVITWSVIGLAVILGSYALTSFVINGLLGTGGGGGGGEYTSACPTTPANDTGCTGKAPAGSWKCISNPDPAKYEIQACLCKGAKTRLCAKLLASPLPGASASAAPSAAASAAPSASASVTMACPELIGGKCSATVADDDCCTAKGTGWSCQVTTDTKKYTIVKCLCAGAKTRVCAKAK